MHHFFVDPSAIEDGIATLSPVDAHHASRVLRLERGERITVSDGCGNVMEATVIGAGRVELGEKRFVAPVHPTITLLQGIAKGERMDVAIEKAVEIGIARIVPFMAERSVVRWDTKRRVKAQVRWAAIAMSAAKQSRSAWLPAVEPVRDGISTDGPTLVFHERATTRLRDALPQPEPPAITIVVGPEGGLTDEEVSSAGGTAVSLGERILRTETAGLVAATAVLYAYGSLG